MRNLVGVIIFLFIIFPFASPIEASTRSSLIVINKKTNTLAYYNEGTLVRTFKVATGRSRSLTPEGKFRIVNKIKNRPFYKENIPGGDPRNPLGDRWLGLEARGTYGTTYAIHGNNNKNSIGKYVSSGCVRMHNDEIRWLFDQIPLYTEVVIVHSDASFDAIATAYGYTVSVPANGNATQARILNGWVTVNDKKLYYDNGVARKGWQIINNNKYFFDRSGFMITGWLTDGGLKYYFDSKGVMQTGWLEIEGKRYFFNDDGVMKIGWHNENGKRYYFDNNGIMKIGWMENNGKKYYFDSTGVMQTGWLTNQENWYYLDQFGAMQTGWINYKGNWYYINMDGVLQSTIASMIDSKAYFDKNKNGNLLDFTGVKYQLHINRPVKSTFIKYHNNLYYLYVDKDWATAS
jgi:glucan-binding YG repeat protein